MSKSKTDTFEDRVVMPWADKIANNRYLIAVRDGFMLAMPLLIIGAFCLLICYFPIAGVTNFMARLFGANWTSFFMIVYHASFAIMAVFVILGIADSLSKHYEQDGLSTGVIALVSFLILTPFATNFTPEGSTAVYSVTGVIPLQWLGSDGLFVGIFAAIAATELVRFVYKRHWTIKMPAGVPPTVSKAFAALIPSIITFLAFDILRLAFTFTSWATVHQFIFSILQVPLTHLGATLAATLVANFFVTFFWMFGIAGGDIVQAIMNPIWIELSAVNLAAF